ncbi:hypothetical protein [Cribrihabitans pelagius]|uniref:hypothetical protein n=1 Tax=Cribrihabitans pelagius TaxID=1765746 RepID=UPI003B5BC861
MGSLGRLPLMARPDGTAGQMARVQLQARLKWPGGGLVLEAALKTASDASVFRGRQGGRPVVVKKFWRRQIRRRQVGETVLALGHFSSLHAHPEFSVNEYLASSGWLGLVIVSFESGTPVDVLLKQPATNRAQILQMCSAWQRWASQGESTWSALPVERYAAEIRSLLSSYPEHPDMELLAELGSALLQMLPHFGTREASRSPGHPDFAPRNLILRPDTSLTAVDIHRSGTFFRARQAAVFLVSKDYNSKRSGAPLLYGLDQDEMQPFLASGGVPEEDTGSVLAFFIGLTFLRMYAKKPGRPRRLQFKRRRIQAYLDDLRHGRRIMP